MSLFPVSGPHKTAGALEACSDEFQAKPDWLNFQSYTADPDEIQQPSEHNSGKKDLGPESSDEDSEGSPRRSKEAKRREKKRDKKSKKRKRERHEIESAKLAKLSKLTKQVEGEPFARKSWDGWIDSGHNLVHRKCHYFDTTGDRQNLAFGSLYSLDVARYTSDDADWGDGDEATTRALTRGQAGIRTEHDGHRLRNGGASRYFAPKSLRRERSLNHRRYQVNVVPKREEAARGVSDFLSFCESSNGPAGATQNALMSDEDLGESVEEHVKRLTNFYNVATRERPHEIDLWLQFAEFQDERLHLLRRRAAAEVKQVKEKKVAIYERALTWHPGSDTLLLALLTEEGKLEDAEQIEKRWRQELGRHAGSPRLWREFLAARRARFSGFSVSSLRRVYDEALQALALERARRVRAGAPPQAVRELAQAQVDMIIELCEMEMQSGHTARGVAQLQAALEYACFAPSELDEVTEAAKLRKFERFWRSTGARIGEDGAAGWAAWTTCGSQWAPPGGSRPAGQRCEGEGALSGGEGKEEEEVEEEEEEEEEEEAAGGWGGWQELEPPRGSPTYEAYDEGAAGPAEARVEGQALGGVEDSLLVSEGARPAPEGGGQGEDEVTTEIMNVEVYAGTGDDNGGSDMRGQEGCMRMEGGGEEAGTTQAEDPRGGDLLPPQPRSPPSPPPLPPSPPPPLPEEEPEEEPEKEPEEVETEEELLARLGLSLDEGMREMGERLDEAALGDWVRMEDERGEARWQPVREHEANAEDVDLDDVVEMDDIRECLLTLPETGLQIYFLERGLRLLQAPLPDPFPSASQAVQQHAHDAEAPRHACAGFALLPETPSKAAIRGETPSGEPSWLGAALSIASSRELWAGGVASRDRFIANLLRLVCAKYPTHAGFRRGALRQRMRGLGGEARRGRGEEASAPVAAAGGVRAAMSGLGMRAAAVALSEPGRVAAKELLAEHSQCLGLWAEYARAEAASGQLTAARRVLARVLAAVPALAPEEAREAPVAFLTAAELELGADPGDTRGRALHVLCSLTESTPFAPLAPPPKRGKETGSVRGEAVREMVAGEARRCAARRAYQRVIEDVIGEAATVPEGGEVAERVGAAAACAALFNYVTAGIGNGAAVYEQLLGSFREGEVLEHHRQGVFHEDLRVRHITLLALAAWSPSRPAGAAPSPSQVGAAVTSGLQEFPSNPMLLRYASEAAERGGVGGRRGLRLLLESAAKRAPGGLGLVAWMEALRAEARAQGSTDSVKGYTEVGVHRIRRLLEHAVSDPTSKSCVMMWRVYLAFEVACGNLDGARRVFYRGINACPWAKTMWLDGFRQLCGSISPGDLGALLDVMRDKEIHLRTDIYEILLESAA
ncbi:hypothetical protein CYMTET_31898 [Cymbomonas tetramitiformis]|uniref:Uncharacterized protein n=1 Tax=Cymbomonas tetramitiformis TaxID=36881 RepID=A0AAE0FG34_9CHLO|nr:hypothetical protein CYMTET_31898 [Cymbomonas tetramitiformis]|eukprot:gene2245-2960_t